MNSRIKDDVQKLFEFWCETVPGPNNTKGHIVESFPESFRDAQILNDIPEFAFPCTFENKTVQTYSFVLSDSKWRFGFCRHDAKTTSAMVLITYLPWHDTFIKFLNVLAYLKKTNGSEFKRLLTEAYHNGVPEPGACLKLQYDQGQSTFMFQRPSQFQLPSIPENHNLNLYYNFVEPKFMIAIFAAMLAERRIIFTSRRLDILSCCVQAANAFLYPMVWQHIFIPILPMKMKDFLSAPMPFLIGVPEAVLVTTRREEIGDVVILNCDKRTLETPFEDVKNMPSDLVGQLKKHLGNQADHRGDRVSKIFLGILVQLIGGYRDAVKFYQGQRITWDQETFIESRPPNLRPFLKDMLELQIFQQFIEERLDMLNTGLGFSDEFELETLRYAERSGKRVRQYKEFLRNVKDKTNPAVKSAVKSVKESSRGMKSAYKDLKSKLRDITPPKMHAANGHGSKAYSHDSGASGGGHYSAPNSPVSSKRPQTDIYRKPSTATMVDGASAATGIAVVGSTANAPSSSSSITHQSSASLMSNLNYANHHSTVSYNHTHNHSHSHTLNSTSPSSPTISATPSSSSSSSDMNILQELQQHSLFKTPTVDRSLKPSISCDYPLRPPRSGSIVTTPALSSTTNMSSFAPSPSQSSPSSHQQRSTTPSPSHAHLPPPVYAFASVTLQQHRVVDHLSDNVNSMCLLDLPANAIPGGGGRGGGRVRGGHNNGGVPSLFDVPPHRPSPPVPPRHSSHNACNTFEMASHHVDRGQRSVSSVPNSSNHHNITLNAFASIVQPEPESVDLINLGANNSFEVEDFDPLNTNAKPLPISKSPSPPPPALPTTEPPKSFNNPLYPHYALPSNGTTFGSSRPKRKDSVDDIELLRKYGLDQFSVLEPFGTRTMSRASAHHARRTAAAAANIEPIDKVAWTTFD